MANRDLQEETDAFVDFLNEWGAKHLGPEYQQKQQVSGLSGAAAWMDAQCRNDSCGIAEGRETRRPALILEGEPEAALPVANGSEYQASPAGIHLVDREISNKIDAPSSQERSGCDQRKDATERVDRLSGSPYRNVPCQISGQANGQPRGASIQVRDREISLGTHPQGCVCLECGIEQKFEEE